MERIPVVDLHEDISYYYSNGDRTDFPLADLSKDVPNRHGDIPKYRRAEVSIVFASIFCLLGTVSPTVSSRLAKGYGLSAYQRAFTPRATDATALEHFKLYYALQRQHPSTTRIIKRSEDVESSKGSIGFLLALEGAYAIEDTNDLELFYNLGLRSLGLTWNFDTQYSATCMSKKDYGLTGEGENLIERCNELGIIIDLAHSSRNTHLEVTEMSKLPVVNSHSNARKLHDVARNLDDGMFEAINKNRGVVGAIFDTNMIGREKTLESLVEHIMYVKSSFGAEVLALGTDYFGLPNGNAARGLEDIGKVSNLFASLREAGMSEIDIEKIAYKNALRVIRANCRRWS